MTAAGNESVSPRYKITLFFMHDIKEMFQVIWVMK